MISRHFGRRLNRIRAHGSGAIQVPPAPAAQSYLGAAMGVALATMGLSIAGGTFAQPSTYTGAALSFSLETLIVSSTGGTYGVPGTFTHYVSPTGTAATWAEAENISTPASPEFAMANEVAGNVVAWRGNAGTYNPTYSTDPNTYDTPAYNPANSGTLGNPIINIAYTGETPTITGDGTYAATGGNHAAIGAGSGAGRSYVIWDGFTVNHADTVAGGYNTCQNICLFNSSYCIIRNCDVVGVVNSASVSGGNNGLIWLQACTGCEIYNNAIHGNTGGGSSVNVCGIWMFTVNSCIIRNNEIYGNNNGIMQKNNNNTLCEIYHNFLHDFAAQYGMAFSFANQVNPTAVGHDVHDNLILNAQTTFFAGNGDQMVSGYTIRNNTCANCLHIFDEDANGWDNLDAYNNIGSEVTGTGVRMAAAQVQARLDYNQWYDSVAFVWSVDFTDYYTIADWRTAIAALVTTGDEANSAFGDPLFVNAAGTTPADFALQGGSPCIGTGLGGVNKGVQNLALVGIQ